MTARSALDWVLDAVSVGLLILGIVLLRASDPPTLDGHEVWGNGWKAIDAIAARHAGLIDVSASYDALLHRSSDDDGPRNEVDPARFAFHADGVFSFVHVGRDEHDRPERHWSSVRRGGQTRHRTSYSQDRADHQRTYDADWSPVQGFPSYGTFLAPAIFSQMPDEWRDRLHVARTERIGDATATVLETTLDQGPDAPRFSWRYWIDLERGANLLRSEEWLDGKLYQACGDIELTRFQDASGTAHWLPRVGTHRSYLDLSARSDKGETGFVLDTRPRQVWSVRLIEESVRINTGVKASRLEVPFSTRNQTMRWSARDSVAPAGEPTVSRVTAREVRETFANARTQFETERLRLQEPPWSTPTWLYLAIAGGLAAMSLAVGSASKWRTRP